MACSICRSEGHNSRTCPQKSATPETGLSNDTANDYALWMRYGGLTKEQAKQLREKVEEKVEEIAPDSHGVIATGKASKMPQRIREALQGTESISAKTDGDNFHKTDDES